MINYIGDLSKADANILKDLAQQSENILEFGMGGSTQILSAYAIGLVTSLETDPGWIERTRKNIELLKISNTPTLKDYYTFVPSGQYDLIFDDGADEFRLPFAFLTWKHLKIGGYMLFHDTRRDRDVKNIASFLCEFSPEIESIFINKDHSNITVIKKKTAEFYENWNEAEGRKPWQSGYEEINMEEFNQLNNGL